MSCRPKLKGCCGAEKGSVQRRTRARVKRRQGVRASGRRARERAASPGLRGRERRASGRWHRQGLRDLRR
eukprot:394358-Prymnesium_polylepis.3